jgi:hypothetical protein
MVIQRPLTPCSNPATSIPSFSLGAIGVSRWKWACEPAEILACCYIIIHGKWQYYRELELPEWKEKIEKFKETFQFRDTDILLGYIDNPAYSRATIDFIDINEWLRFIEQHSTSP